MLGTVPRGFLETVVSDPSCTAFVRGFMVDKQVYDAMSSDQRLALHSLPRWTLYGGPLLTRELAEDWDVYLFFWANQNGRVWISDAPACLAPETFGHKWPANKSFQWTWVYETSRKKVVKFWNPAMSRYEWKWES